MDDTNIRDDIAQNVFCDKTCSVNEKLVWAVVVLRSFNGFSWFIPKEAEELLGLSKEDGERLINNLYCRDLITKPDEGCLFEIPKLREVALIPFKMEMEKFQARFGKISDELMKLYQNLYDCYGEYQFRVMIDTAIKKDISDYFVLKVVIEKNVEKVKEELKKLK